MSTLMPTASRRILVIDDNRAIHEDFAKILTRAAPANDLADLEADLFDSPVVEASSAPTFEVTFADQGQDGARMVAEAIAAGTRSRWHSWTCACPRGRTAS